MTSLYKTETQHHPQGKTCRHYSIYRLTCDAYDALRARAGGNCEICGIAEEEAPRGGLVIDHFRGRRTTVIRGLICTKCNGSVMQCIDGRRVWGKNRKWEERAREYERNSWQVPSEEAREEMAARTEMLSKYDPRYVPKWPQKNSRPDVRLLAAARLRTVDETPASTSPRLHVGALPHPARS